MNEQASAEKIYYIDVLRAVATLMTVFIHVSLNNWYGYIGTTNWTVFTAYGCLVRACVPVFFMISGALLLDENRKLDVKRLFTHNILRLAGFLLVWSFIYQLYHLGVRREAGDISAAVMLQQSLENIFTGSTQAHLWFIYSLIGLYLCLPVLRVFTGHAQKRHLEYFLLLWALFQTVFPQLSTLPLLRCVSINAAKLDVSLISGYVGYFILGHYLHKYPPIRTLCMFLAAPACSPLS